MDGWSDVGGDERRLRWEGALYLMYQRCSSFVFVKVQRPPTRVYEAVFPLASWTFSLEELTVRDQEGTGGRPIRFCAFAMKTPSSGSF